MREKILGILVLCWMGAMWFTGGWTEKELGRQIEQVENLTHSLMTAEIVRYEKGWLRSEAVTRWTFGAPGDDSGHNTLELVHHISHGPNPFFGWAQIATEPVLSPEVKTVLWPYFWDAPITMITRVGFTGTRKVEIHSPETSTEHGPVKTSRIRSLADVMDLPKLLIERSGKARLQEMREHRRMAPGNVVWKGLSGKGELTDNDGWIEITLPGLEGKGGGTGSMNLAGLYFKASKNRADGETFWSRNTEMGFEEIALAIPGAGSFHMGKTAISGGDKIEPDGTVTHYVNETVNDLMAESAGEKIHIRQARMSLNLGNLDRQAFEELSSAFRAQMDAQIQAVGTHQMGDTKAVPATRQSTDALLSVLRGSPVFEVEEFRISSDLGSLEASARAGFDGNGFTVSGTDSSPAAKINTLRRVHFTLSGSISDSLLEALFTWGNLEKAIQRQRGPAGASALAKRMAREQITGLVINGLLSPDGDRYELSVSMQNNTLLLNGRQADGAMGQFLGRMMNGA